MNHFTHPQNGQSFLARNFFESVIGLFFSIFIPSFFLCANPPGVMAAKLDPSQWAVYDFSGLQATNLSDDLTSATNTVQNLTDNNLSTFTTLANPEVLLIDLSNTCVIDRLVVIGTSNQFSLWPNYSIYGDTPPLGVLFVYVGDSATTTKQVASYNIPYDAGDPVEADADIRFNPASGRYVRVELHTQETWGTNCWPGWPLDSQPPGTNVAMNVRELELYGFTGAAVSQTNLNAVVLPTNAAAPLVLAAQDLSYYLGELTGSPHPIISPEDTNQFSGTIYRIVDLKSLAPDYATMMSNIASGVLNTNVQVTSSGREIVFASWPYRCVLWSVWEFLERQGIRWVYPDVHGDSVPTGAGVNLSIVPFVCHPSTESIYANFDVNSLLPWPIWESQPIRQEYLYFWRNHWTFTWGGSYGPLGGSEIPTLPSPGIPINSDYVEGFDGYPESFGSVVPQRILDLNSNWWGYSAVTGARVSPETSGAPAFCMDNPSLISWVASKMTNIAAAVPEAFYWPLNLMYMKHAYNLLPNDSTTFCADSFCTDSNGPPQPNPEPWVKQYDNACSGEYYSFVTAVANQVQAMGSSALVGAMAYADVFPPPSNITTFPTNVQVEVCLYGAPNLPMSAAANAGMKAALDGWHARCQNLATWDYALLHTDYQQPDPRLPVPLIAGTVDRSQYLASIGALNGGCQANLTSLPYNPWNFYAYPRTRWNTNQTAGQLEQEFFTGYFREAAAPMLAYYQALENYQVAQGVSMHFGGYAYGITPGSFPLSVLATMQTNLLQAQTLATNCFIIQRIANIAAGFGWVITNCNLAGVNLSDISSYPVLDPEPGPVTIDLTKMIKNPPTYNSAYIQGPDQGYSIIDWWFGGGGSMIQQTFNMAAGTYRVDVVANGSQSGSGLWPHMNFYLGPVWTGVTVDSYDDTTYTFTNTVQAGIFDLKITFYDTGHPPPTLIVKSIKITRQ
jgi:hypothetical protein